MRNLHHVQDHALQPALRPVPGLLEGVEVKREWKPGDVVLCRGERGIVTSSGGSSTKAEYIEFGVGKTILLGEGDNLRPLVVIDPEDEVVERLGAALASRLGWTNANGADTARADALRDVLREFANPTPPRVWTDGDVVTSLCRAYHRHDGRWWPTRPGASTPAGYRDADMEEMLENDSCAVLREQAAGVPQ